MAFPKFNRVLIINTFGIGDVLFTTPLITNLKKYNPDMYIGYLSNRRTTPVLETNKNVNKIIVYERDEFDQLRKENFFKHAAKWIEFVREIREEKFDLVIDLSVHGMLTFITYLAGIKYRIGYHYKRRIRFLTHRIPLIGYENKHVVDYYLGLLPLVGITPQPEKLELSLDMEDYKWAKDFILKYQSSHKRMLVAMIPGGGASWGKEAHLKRWPAEYFAKLADKIIENLSVDIILMGDEKEHELCAQVAGLMKNKPLCAFGKTTIRQFAALSSLCALVVANDGGPLHVAVAAGAKTVSIFGPVDEAVYGPYPRENQIIVSKDLACRPCYRRFKRANCDHLMCLKGVAVEDVYAHVEESLMEQKNFLTKAAFFPLD